MIKLAYTSRQKNSKNKVKVDDMHASPLPKTEPCGAKDAYTLTTMKAMAGDGERGGRSILPYLSHHPSQSVLRKDSLLTGLSSRGEQNGR